jgi:hypothetical protein
MHALCFALFHFHGVVRQSFGKGPIPSSLKR